MSSEINPSVGPISSSTSEVTDLDAFPGRLRGRTLTHKPQDLEIAQKAEKFVNQLENLESKHPLEMQKIIREFIKNQPKEEKGPLREEIREIFRRIYEKKDPRLFLDLDRAIGHHLQKKRKSLPRISEEAQIKQEEVQEKLTQDVKRLKDDFLDKLTKPSKKSGVKPESEAIPLLRGVTYKLALILEPKSADDMINLFIKDFGPDLTIAFFDFLNENLLDQEKKLKAALPKFNLRNNSTYKRLLEIQNLKTKVEKLEKKLPLKESFPLFGMNEPTVNETDQLFKALLSPYLPSYWKEEALENASTQFVQNLVDFQTFETTTAFLFALNSNTALTFLTTVINKLNKNLDILEQQLHRNIEENKINLASETILHILEIKRKISQVNLAGKQHLASLNQKSQSTSTSTSSREVRMQTETERKNLVSHLKNDLRNIQTRTPSEQNNHLNAAAHELAINSDPRTIHLNIGELIKDLDTSSRIHFAEQVISLLS